MKKVVRGKDLHVKLKEAINLLCDTVKVTLGPKGSNIIIDHSTFSPFITNDGVTIAENIESDDPVINTILELAKEASFKTNEIVGDGTTTTLVLLQSIFNNGLNLIKEGINPIILKRELDNSLEKVKNILKSKSRKIKDNEIINLISISANDKIIGMLIRDAYFKVGNTFGINVYESNDYETKVEYLNGYTFEISMASPYYFLSEKDIKISNALILLIDSNLQDIEDIAIIINKIIEQKKNLIIIAKDYDEQLINDILALNMEIDIKIYLLKSLFYGNKEKYFYDDLKDITGCKIINNTNEINLNDLGSIKKINLNKDYANIEFDNNEIINKKIIDLETSCNEDEDSFKRLSMLKSGIVNILVGAPTITERREKKMRVDDALCALSTIDDGVLPGSGVTLLEISDNLKVESVGDILLKDALKMPFSEIMYNAGLDKDEIEKMIKNSNYKKIYNVNKNSYEDIMNTEVIDSTKVIINALINATSIAGMLLTTSSLIINEYQNNLNKTNDYNEL